MAFEGLVLRDTMRAHTDMVTAIATPIDNSDMIVTSSRDKFIILWNLTKDDKNYGVARRRLTGHSHFVQDVVLSSDSQFAFSDSRKASSVSGIYPPEPQLVPILSSSLLFTISSMSDSDSLPSSSPVNLPESSPVKVEMVTKSTSQRLVDKFFDVSEYNFDYQKSGIWSPPVQRNAFLSSNGGIFTENEFLEKLNTVMETRRRRRRRT